MLLRTTFAVATAALALSFLGDTAPASCLDDFQARKLNEGFVDSPKSGLWPYVHQSGTATVTIYGDALISDYQSNLFRDMPLYAQVVAANAVDATADFADCVAG